MNNDNPILNDYVFKQVFGKQENEKILISFLNAMLNGDYNIKSAKVINSDLPRFSELGRTILLDVQVVTDDGTHIDIEVQQGYRPDLVDRMFVYGANMVTRYNKKSTSYNRTKCIAIWILDCNMPDFEIFGKEQVIGEFCFHSINNMNNVNKINKINKTEVYLPMEGLKVYPIELKKGTDIENISTFKETWINFLKTSNDISKPEELEEVHDAYKEMLTTAGSEEYRNYVDALEKKEELIRNDLFLAKKKSREEGLAEGEHKKAIETARKMLLKGFSIKDVVDCSGLSMEEVEKL